MNNKKDLNDKLFDVILDEALDLYTIDLANEEHNPDMTDDEIRTMLAQKDLVYKKVIHNVNVSPKPKYRFGMKRIILIAAVMVILIAMATNVAAIKTFLFKVYTQISGATLNIGIYQNSKYDYEQILLFKNNKDIIIPKLLPQDMKLSDILDTEFWLKLRYDNGDNWIVLSESIISGSKNGKDIETENNTYFVKDYNILGMYAQIVKMNTENTDDILLVSWCSDKIMYELSTNCSELELEEILLNLGYLYK
ncbi:MAG: DUF4367 domain-containing protein [bacterium]|nr:DUF4367 domain-containing protein [bacterium]